MFGSSAQDPNSAQPTASVAVEDQRGVRPPSRTSRSLSSRLLSASKVFSVCIVWNHVHQQPPKTPL